MLIKSDTDVRHLIIDTAGCPTLQYADDTLLLVRGELSDVQRLKTLLDKFAQATGLQINYAKSTAVPIYMDEETRQQCVSMLGCRREGFQQNYLGLPLSTTKLRLSAFSVQIAKADKYLAGWQTALLNHMGCATLVSSVIDSQLIYAMCALPIPPGVLEQIDQRRRSFLWAATSSSTGAKSLVAWDHVYDTKDNGDLSLKDLRIQNTCLLLKMIHRLHQNNQSS
jgi:hypothetical protein